MAGAAERFQVRQVVGCSSASRKRSQTIISGRPHSLRTARTSPGRRLNSQTFGDPQDAGVSEHPVGTARDLVPSLLLGQSGDPRARRQSLDPSRAPQRNRSRPRSTASEIDPDKGRPSRSGTSRPHARVQSSTVRSIVLSSADGRFNLYERKRPLSRESARALSRSSSSFDLSSAEIFASGFAFRIFMPGVPRSLVTLERLDVGRSPGAGRDQVVPPPRACRGQRADVDGPQR